MPGRSAQIVIAAALLSGCGEMRRDFLPRTHTVSTSPDGRSQAWVRQGFSIDPPDDHLFLKRRTGEVTKLLDLAPDADWCHTIIWTRDSSRVGFLITENRLSVFDAASAEHLAEVVLVKIDGYPGSEAVRDIAFTDDGRGAMFERIDRWTSRGLSHETIVLPTFRRRVRLVWGDSDAANRSTWARLVATDGRETRVVVKPSADGVASLPAFDDRPLRLAEFFARQPGRTVILRDVAMSPEPIVVRFDR